MADTKLTNEQAKALLDKLANDDAFRADFSSKPAAALRSLGVEAETVVQLPAACLERKTLSSKDEFQKLLQDSADSAVNSAAEMIIPKIGFTAKA